MTAGRYERDKPTRKTDDRVLAKIINSLGSILVGHKQEAKAIYTKQERLSIRKEYGRDIENMLGSIAAQTSIKVHPEIDE